MNSAMAALVNATRSTVTKYCYSDDFNDVKVLNEIAKELAARSGGSGPWVARRDGAILAKFPTRALAQAYAVLTGDGVSVEKDE